MKKFEKISIEEFNKEGFDDLEGYEELKKPHRGSKFSAGYDFSVAWETTLPKGETVKIPTLVKADMDEDEVLLIVVRSSLGFKHNVRLANTVGVVDKDYYNNENNEGHIFIKLYNPNDYDIVLKKGERFAQGIFVKYGITVDDDVETERTGGIGSTGK